MGKKLIIKGADFSANGIAPEYTRLSCLVTTSSTQVIASPVPFTPAGRVIAEFASVTTSSTKRLLFGHYAVGSSYTAKMFRFENLITYGTNNTTGMCAYVNGTTVKNCGSMTDGLKHTINATRATVKLDNSSTSMASSTTTANISASQFGLLGQLSNNSSSDYNGVGVGVKIYSIKIYSDKDDESTLVLDAIPVKRNADDVICLYDKISGTYLTTKDGTNPNYESL